MNPIKAWNRFMFGLISARPLGLFRIVFGLLMMAYLANMVLEFDFWYTGTGLLQGTEAREAAGPFRISPLQFVTDPITPRIFHAVGFVAATWRDAGMADPLGERRPLSHDDLALSPERLLQWRAGCRPLAPELLHDVLPERGRLLARLPTRDEATRDPGRALIAPWGVRLLQMQLCLIYFQSCVIKNAGPAWMDGTARITFCSIVNSTGSTWNGSALIRSSST